MALRAHGYLTVWVTFSWKYRQKGVYLLRVTLLIKPLHTWSYPDYNVGLLVLYCM